jgi:hypothetical protein
MRAPARSQSIAGASAGRQIDNDLADSGGFAVGCEESDRDMQ